MNYGYPPGQGPYNVQQYPYPDQKPSTSGVPFQQVYDNNPQMPLRHPGVNAMRQAHMFDWMNQNPAFGYYNPSPAPSVHSHASLGSMNSAMSKCTINTQLTINTNFSHYSYQQQGQMAMGTENVFPRKVQSLGNWSPKEIANCASECIEILRSYRPWEPRAKEAIEKIRALIYGPRYAFNPVEPSPLDYLDEMRFTGLLKAIFSSMEMDDESMNNMNPAFRGHWEKWASTMLKAILQIYALFKNSNSRDMDKYEQAIDLMDNRPLHIVGYLLQPAKEYSKNAVNLFRCLFLAETEHQRIRKRKRLQIIIKDPFFIRRLVKMVAPDQEYLNSMERQLAMDVIRILLSYNASREHFLNTNIIPEMLRRYFKTDGDEPVLKSIPNMFLKLAQQQATQEKSVMVDKFFEQFEKANGYQLMAEMLSHGSVRVLIECLKLINHPYPQRISLVPGAPESLTLATLKLVGSTDISVTNMALHFISNIAADNSKIKGLITRTNGIEIIFSVFRIEYQSTQKPRTNEQILKYTSDIHRTGLIILYSLLKKQDENTPTANGCDNEEHELAMRQVISYSYLPELICNYLEKRTQDGDRSLLLKLLRTILTHCDAGSRRAILTKNVIMEDTKQRRSVAESVVGSLFNAFIYFDNINANTAINKSIQEKIQPIVELISHIYDLCKMDGAKEAIVDFIGRAEPENHNLVSLFLKTGERHLRENLINLMGYLTMIDDPLLQQLPKKWARSNHFKFVMEYYLNCPIQELVYKQEHISSLAGRLLKLADISPHPTPP